jgi:hypothetical protein
MKPKNARFWDYCNGTWTKITLRPGQLLHWHHYQDTDEGFSAITRAWEHNGLSIHYCEMSKARDCDGLFEDVHECCAPLDKLAAKDPYTEPGAAPEPFKVPQWMDMGGSHRDHQAEAAGY